MILIDTSAWVEFLRDTGSPICQRVDDLLATEIATCDVVRMEVLAGARDEQHLQQLRRLLIQLGVDVRLHLQLEHHRLEHDARAADVDQGVRRAEVDGHVPTGKGQKVIASLYESTVFLVGQHMAQKAVTGEAARPMPVR